MTSTESASHGSRELSSKMPRYDALDDTLVKAWETILNEQRSQVHARVATALDNKVAVKFMDCHIKIHCTNWDDVIAPEDKIIIKETIKKNLWTSLRVTGQYLEDFIPENTMNHPIRGL